MYMYFYFSLLQEQMIWYPELWASILCEDANQQVGCEKPPSDLPATVEPWV